MVKNCSGGDKMNQSMRDKWCEKEISDLDYIRHLEAENAKLKELEKEQKKCGHCAHVMICPWSLGADDEKCGKFKPIKGAKQ